MTHAMSVTQRADAELEDFISQCVEGLSHQVNGHSEPFLGVWSRAGDVAILGAIGSHAQGWDQVRTHLLGASRSLAWSGLTVERLLTTASGDLAVTVVLEHMTRDSADGPESRTLRTTQAYRREDGRWRLILRHANTVTAEDEAHEQALISPTHNPERSRS
jgi:ketosteroid isomerase-like protein